MKQGKKIVGRPIWLIIKLSGLISGIWSADIAAQNNSNQIWYTYNHQAITSKHWGYMLDLNHRTTDINKNISVLSAARFGATYLTDKNHRISAGYAWFGRHFKDGEKNLLVENRFWEQYQVFKQQGKTSFFHRIRVEQRWHELMPVNENKREETAFSVRARYMYQHQGPIWPVTKERKFGVWWQGGSEMLLHAGDGIEKHYFDQLRIIGGIILMPSREINLAILYQYINQYRPSVEEHFNIHAIRLTLLHQIDFSGKSKNSGFQPFKQHQ